MGEELFIMKPSHFFRLPVFIIPVLFLAVCPVYSDTVSITVPMWFSPSDKNTSIKEVYDDFLAAGRDIEIKVNSLGGNAEKYTNNLLLMIDSGKTTDLAIVPTRIVGELSRSGQLLNLSDRIDKHKMNDFLDNLLNVCMVNNNLYGLPYDTDVMVIYYNKDIFENLKISYEYSEGTWDWDRLIELSEKATIDKNGDGQMDVWGFGFPAGNFFNFINYFLPWYFCAGGTIDSTNGLTINSDAVSNVIELFREMVLISKASPPATPSYLGKDIYRGLINGNLTMAITGSWVYYSIEKEGSFGVLPVPPVKKGQRSITYCGGWSVIVFDKGERRNAVSLKFADMLTSEKSMILKLKEKHFLPVLKSVLLGCIANKEWPDSFFAEQLLEHAYSYQETSLIKKEVMKIQDAIHYVLIKKYKTGDAIKKVINRY